MGKYKETYTDLYHGTTVDAAEEIVRSQHFIPSDGNNWCGEGVYFYDNKSKARWAAERKCGEIYKKTGVRVKATHVKADIVDLDRDYILDLRSYKDLQSFVDVVDSLLKISSFDIAEDMDEEEKIIILRGILISYYASEYNMKLVIGNFQQRSQPKFVELFPKAESLNLVIGVETIYCAKDSSILSNIRGA